MLDITHTVYKTVPHKDNVNIDKEYKEYKKEEEEEDITMLDSFNCVYLIDRTILNQNLHLSRYPCNILYIELECASIDNHFVR